MIFYKNGHEIRTWVSPDGKSAHASISTKPGPHGSMRHYSTGNGEYVAEGELLADSGRVVSDAGGISGGNEVRGQVTASEKYPPPPSAPKEPHLTYGQKSGELTGAGGERLGKGYSGRGEAKNKVEKEHEKNTGPIPRGNYKVAEVVDDPSDPRCQKMGPRILRLEPADQTTRDRLAAIGRDGFYVHGGGSDASTGCIIMGPQVRARIGRGTLIHVGD